MAWGQYRVEISNTGRSIASNCKPRIRLVALRETTEKVLDLGPDGCELHDVTVQKRYVIDLIPTWNESESPTRIDLNRRESAQFDLFYVHSDATPPNGSNTDIRFGDWKPFDDRRDRRGLGNGANSGRNVSPERFSRPVVETNPELKKELFNEIK